MDECDGGRRHGIGERCSSAGPVDRIRAAAAALRNDCHLPAERSGSLGRDLPFGGRRLAPGCRGRRAALRGGGRRGCRRRCAQVSRAHSTWRCGIGSGRVHQCRRRHGGAEPAITAPPAPARLPASDAGRLLIGRYDRLCRAGPGSARYLCGRDQHGVLPRPGLQWRPPLQDQRPGLPPARENQVRRSHADTRCQRRYP